MDEKELKNFNIVTYCNCQKKITAMKIIDLISEKHEIVIFEGNEKLSIVINARNKAIEQLINKRSS